MIIKDVMAAMKDASGPVVKAWTSGPAMKVVVLGLKEGLSLKAHKTAISTRLLVVSGSIIYRGAEGSVSLEELEDLSIPINEMHSVEARADSICLLIQG